MKEVTGIDDFVEMDEALYLFILFWPKTTATQETIEASEQLVARTISNGLVAVTARLALTQTTGG
jgi:hypothetical protein